MGRLFIIIGAGLLGLGLYQEFGGKGKKGKAAPVAATPENKAPHAITASDVAGRPAPGTEANASTS